MGKQIILIGGMPTAGKSTIALALSKHLGLPWISTDQIGTVMRAAASRASHHDLFTWHDRDDFRYLDELTASEIADGEFAKGEAVWPGVRKLIYEDYTWADGFIVEGDDVLPHLVSRDLCDARHVRAVFIGDHDIERVRKAVLARNFAGDDAGAHPDEVKDREIGWILDYGEKLKNQARAHRMPWVEVQKDEHDLTRVLDVLERGH
jgi:2-phosphoglycerate kinase